MHNVYGTHYYGEDYYGIVGDVVQKIYIYKVYDGPGANASLMGVWSEDVISEPSFTTAINGGPGELKVRLARDFDNFGEDDDVALANRVDCIVYDADNMDGLLLYRGFISAYAQTLDKNKEYVEVTILPYSTEAASSILKSGSATTVPYLSQDPGAIFRDVLNKFQQAGGNLGSTSSSIDNTDTTVSYTFNTNTVKEAFDKIIELAPDFWWWRVDPDGTVYFKEKPTGVTHDLSIGQQIITMEPQKRIESIINRVYFTGGGSPPLFMVFERSGSISTWGLKAVKKVDQRVTSSTTAQTISEKILAENESPEVRMKLVISDNNGLLRNTGYDIESIKVGDTIRVKNLNFGTKSETLWDVAYWDVDVWDQTLASIAGSALLVVKTRYTPNAIEVETSSRFPQVAKRIEDINRNLEDSQTVNNPSTPS